MINKFFKALSLEKKISKKICNATSYEDYVTDLDKWIKVNTIKNKLLTKILIIGFTILTCSIIVSLIIK